MKRIVIVNFADSDMDTIKLRFDGVLKQHADVVSLVGELIRVSDIEYYDKQTEVYVRFDQLSIDISTTRIITILVRGDNVHNDRAPLLIQGRDLDIAKHLMVNGYSIRLSEIPQAELGTGLITWDGSVLLMKYLEQNPSIVMNKSVIEVGAGTGVAGITAAMLHARQVLLTDLAYAIPNLRANIALNVEALAQQEHSNCIEARVLDWSDPTSYPLSNIAWDVILAADVVWLDSLVHDLVQALAYLCSSSTTILLAHQTRSLATDRRLFDELAKHNFQQQDLGRDFYPHEYRSSRVSLYKISRDTG
jgi:predicted nicotinamide N-methyase